MVNAYCGKENGENFYSQWKVPEKKIITKNDKISENNQPLSFEMVNPLNNNFSS